MQPKFIIVATVRDTGERYECFTWTRDAQSGIARAELEARLFGMADKLRNFRAEPVRKLATRR